MLSRRRISMSPSGLSKCPRSSSTSSVSRSWRNSWWKYRRSSPFPRCSGLWSRTVDIPVPRGGVRRLQGFSSLERASERNVEQIVDFPLFGGGLQDFRPRRGSTTSSSSSHVPAGAVDEPFHGFFRTSPRPKKVRSWDRTRGSELIADFTSSTPSAYEVHNFSEDGNFHQENDKKTWMRLPSGFGTFCAVSQQSTGTIQGLTWSEAASSWSSWQGVILAKCVFFLVHPLTQTIMAALEWLGRAPRHGVSLRFALGRISCPLRSRCSHLESGA